jgi:hypothetical protein
MKFLKFKYTFAACGLALGLYSCGPDQIGPDLKGASENFDENISFELIQNGSSDIDTLKFNEFDEAYFSATKFSEEVTWEIVITGLSSGAVKLINGTGNLLNSESTNWMYGRSTNEYFFQENEEVQSELNIVGLDTVYSINGVKFGAEFDWHMKTVAGVKHIVIDKFNYDVDFGIDTIPTRSGLNDASTDQADPDIVTELSEMRVEGLKSFSMYGTDNNNNGWLASKNHERLLELLADSSLADLPISADVDASNLFVSAFVYGDPSYPNTTVEFKIYEADAHYTGSRDELREFALDSESLLNQPKSDGWIYDVVVNWSGWRHVVVPYSAFRAANDPNSGGGGNRVKQSGRISAMAISLLSYPSTGDYVKTYVDFVTITENGYPQLKK